jgi:hypothetical protein
VTRQVLNSACCWRSHLGPGTSGRLEHCQKQKYHFFIFSRLLFLFLDLHIYILSPFTFFRFHFLICKKRCPCSCHEDVLGRVDVCLQLTLSLGTRWIWVVSFTVRKLFSGRGPQYPLGGTQGPSGRFWAQKNPLRLSGLEPRTFRQVT